MHSYNSSDRVSEVSTKLKKIAYSTLWNVSIFAWSVDDKIYSFLCSSAFLASFSLWSMNKSGVIPIRQPRNIHSDLDLERLNTVLEETQFG